MGLAGLNIDQNQYAFTNGQEYSISFPSSLTRTFDLDTSTLTFNTADLEIYGNDGLLVTSSTSPFSFDGTKLAFRSSDSLDAGEYKFRGLGITFYVFEDPAELENFQFEITEEEIVLESGLTV